MNLVEEESFQEVDKIIKKICAETGWSYLDSAKFILDWCKDMNSKCQLSEVKMNRIDTNKLKNKEEVNMKKVSIGDTKLNNNGITYTLICYDPETQNAVIHGGHDYVYISSWNRFVECGSYDGSIYFPAFSIEDSAKALDSAVYYFEHHTFKPEDPESFVE